MSSRRSALPARPGPRRINEVGGAAADVDDQHQLLAVDLRFIVESRGQRFELELDVGEADLAGDLAQSVLRGLVGGRIVVHEEHRATEHHALEIAAGGGLGAALEFGDEAREQHAERNRTALDLGGAVDQRAAQQQPSSASGARRSRPDSRRWRPGQLTSLSSSWKKMADGRVGLPSSSDSSACWPGRLNTVGGRAEVDAACGGNRGIQRLGGKTAHKCTCPRRIAPCPPRLLVRRGARPASWPPAIAAGGAVQTRAGIAPPVCICALDTAARSETRGSVVLGPAGRGIADRRRRLRPASPVTVMRSVEGGEGCRRWADAGVLEFLAGGRGGLRACARPPCGRRRTGKRKRWFSSWRPLGNKAQAAPDHASGGLARRLW